MVIQSDFKPQSASSTHGRHVEYITRHVGVDIEPEGWANIMTALPYSVRSASPNIIADRSDSSPMAPNAIVTSPLVATPASMVVPLAKPVAGVTPGRLPNVGTSPCSTNEFWSSAISSKDP